MGQRPVARRAERRHLRPARRRQQVGHRQPGQPPAVPVLPAAPVQHRHRCRQRRLQRARRHGLDRCVRRRRAVRLACGGARTQRRQGRGDRLRRVRRVRAARHVGRHPAHHRPDGRGRDLRRAAGRAHRTGGRALRPGRPPAAAGARHHAGAAGLRLPAAVRAGLRHRHARRPVLHRHLRGPAHGAPDHARSARRRPRGAGGVHVARRERVAAAAHGPAAAGPQADAPRPQPDDHDGALDGRHRRARRRGRPRRGGLLGPVHGGRGQGARRRHSHRADRRLARPYDRGSRRPDRPERPRRRPAARPLRLGAGRRRRRRGRAAALRGRPRRGPTAGRSPSPRPSTRPRSGSPRTSRPASPCSAVRRPGRSTSPCGSSTP
ncbi:UNVERIFIED_CONTAM: hypothetical protein RKD43_004183 [Streptomyces graminofaciens]